MRAYILEDEKEALEFAKRAAKRFSENPDMTTFTDKEITSGCFLP